MGAVAKALADKIVITSDNPRSEAPQTIIEHILSGVGRSEHMDVQVDRALAIASAVGQANNADVILLAGKGHEATQEIAGVKSYFSDCDHAVPLCVSAHTIDIRFTHEHCSTNAHDDFGTSHAVA